MFIDNVSNNCKVNHKCGVHVLFGSLVMKTTGLKRLIFPRLLNGMALLPQERFKTDG